MQLDSIKMVAAGTMMSQPSRAAGGEIHSFHSPALKLDAPSMAAGLGSLDVVQLHHQLQSGAAGVKASPRLLFDVPTMHAFIAVGGGLSPSGSHIAVSFDPNQAAASSSATMTQSSTYTAIRIAPICGASSAK